jgi:MFS family permease
MRSSRWLMLGLGTAAQTAGTAFLYGLPFLLPALHTELPGASLAQLGALVAMPGLGMVVGVLAWGALTDRRGERLTITLGLGGAAAMLSAAAYTSPPALHAALFGAGVAGSAVYAASGRVVVGWFPQGERGLAMGIRQASQPVGVAIAGAALPALAAAGGVRLALAGCAALCLIACVVCGLLLTDAPSAAASGPAAEPSPYRHARLWRLHGGSALFVVAQVVTGTFATEYLVTQRGWAPTVAGPLLGAAQLVAAAGRIGAGRWSDRVADRMVPLRLIAVVAGGALATLAAAAALHSGAAVTALLVAGVLTVSWHGIAYAGVSEAAPPSWAGRAIGAQTSIQNVAGVITPPVFGALIEARGFPVGYAAAAAMPLLAALALPWRPHRAPAPMPTPSAPPSSVPSSAPHPR